MHTDKGSSRRGWLKKCAAAVVAVGLPLGGLLAQKPEPPAPIPPGTPVTITVTQVAPAAPDVSINMLSRTARVTPVRSGCAHTGGGNIDVAQPSPDVLIVTMTGVAVATGSPFGPATAVLNYDLEQCFEVSFDKPTVKAAKLVMEGRVIGLLRSHCKGGGSAEENGWATVAAGPQVIQTLTMPGHSVAGGENLSVNDRVGPITVPVSAGKHVLHQAWHVAAAMPKVICPIKSPSAEFAPDPALDPLWINYKEPFHGAIKKDFGFQVIVRVAPDEPANGKAKVEEIPPPKENGVEKLPPELK